MDNPNKTDLAQRALGIVTVKRNGLHIDLRDVTLNGIAHRSAEEANKGIVGGAIGGSFAGPAGALEGAALGGAGGAILGAGEEVWDKTKVEKAPFDSFDLQHPGAANQFDEPGYDPGNPFGSDAGRRAFASDVLARALQKDAQFLASISDATRQSAAALRAKGLSTSAADREAAAMVRNGVIDQIAGKVKAQYDKNMGIRGDQSRAPYSDSLLHPQGAMPQPTLPYSDALMHPQTAMPEPAGNTAPVTGDRPSPADAPSDDGDEFGPKSLPPGRRLYDSVNPFNLMKGLL